MALAVVGAEVVRGPLVIWVNAMSDAASSHVVTVGAEASGRIQRVYVKEFDTVRPGDTLMIVDTTELVFALQQAQNSFRRAENTFRNTLISDSIMVRDPEDRRKREVAARLSSGLEDAELSLTRARLEYSKAATRAPIGGRVANMKVAPGQRIGAGGELLTLIVLQPLLVQAQVLESEIGKVRVGNTARLTFASQSDTQYIGRVVSTNPVVDPNIRTARVTIEVDNPGGRLIPGMHARAEIQSVTYQNRLLVPKGAILQRSDGREMLFVYSPNKDKPGEGTAEWRYVKTGLKTSEFTEILPGEDGSQKLVEPGEIVLVDGHYTIEHGAAIRLVDKLLAGQKRL
jgi:membrane fusion protein (multidrug efflux system)